MRTLDDVFGSWTTLTEMASDIGETRDRVEKWRERKRIPDKYWPSLIGALRDKGKKLSADDLLAMHVPKPARRSSERLRA